MRDPAGTELAQVVVFLVSADPDSVPGVFRMRADLPITGSPLRGHLRSATLIDLHGQPVYQVALETDYNAAIESTRSLHDAALVASLRTRLERDELLVELTTDLPGLGVLRSPLKLDRRITRVDAPLCRHERWPIG